MEATMTGYILGLSRGYIGIVGLYRDIGKGHGRLRFQAWGFRGLQGLALRLWV